MQVLYKSFFVNECVSNGSELNLPEAEQGRLDLTALCAEMAEDGISIVARDITTNKIAGIAINKIQVTHLANIRNLHLSDICSVL